MPDALSRKSTSERRQPTIEEFRESLELMADAMALPSERPSYIKYCATCDHPEGDHAGRANWHGPRRGPCWRDHCACERFLLPDEKEAA